jgi:RNA polymerase I-specific transcription initiation factor RRN5
MDTESVESGSESSYNNIETPMRSSEQVRKRKGKALAPVKKRRRDGVDHVSDVAAESSLSKKDRPKAKHIRLKGHYSNQYRQLLNEVISDANEAPHVGFSSNRGSSDEFETSQIGMTIWTGDQKNALFHAIERYGRDDLPRLAVVTEKSEQEVFGYLQLLRDGLLEYSTMPEGGLRAMAGKLPPAAELSEACCEALGISAEALSWYQESWDSKQEMKEYGDYWLLNREVANKIDERAFDDDKNDDDDDDNDSELEDGLETNSRVPSISSTSQSSKSPILEAIPAAKLLNLSKFLDLSERIFMNSTDPSTNWRTYEDPSTLRTTGKQVHIPEDAPSIFHTTFNDFHRVIVSLTRRLVHVSIFQATARLRATDSLGRKSIHTPAVQRRDVLTALRVTGVKEDSIEYWATLPRRSKHNWIYQKNAARRSKMIPVNSQEAERWLSLPLKRVRPMDEGTELEVKFGGISKAELNVGQMIRDGNLGEEKDEDEEMIESSESQGHSLTDPDSNLTDNEISNQSLTNLESANDRYFEILDIRHSRTEERRLWKLLELPEPDYVDLNPLQKPPEPERAPLVGYGSPQEEWRDWTEPAAEWELLIPTGGGSEESSGEVNSGSDGRIESSVSGGALSLASNEDSGHSEVDAEQGWEEGSSELSSRSAESESESE